VTIFPVVGEGMARARAADAAGACQKALADVQPVVGK
jgi:hypothetical protein